MYVSMYVSMHVPVYLCMHERMYVSTYIRVRRPAMAAKYYRRWHLLLQADNHSISYLLAFVFNVRGLALVILDFIAKKCQYYTTSSFNRSPLLKPCSYELYGCHAEYF